MNPSTIDAGVISVLMTQLELQRLPRVFALKDKVDGGQLLGDFDIEFLEEAFVDAGKVGTLIERHPEYQLVTAGPCISTMKSPAGHSRTNSIPADREG